MFVCVGVRKDVCLCAGVRKGCVFVCLCMRRGKVDGASESEERERMEEKKGESS